MDFGIKENSFNKKIITMKNLILTVAMLLFSLGCFAQYSISVVKAKELLRTKKNMLVVDVRTPQEYESEHLEYAKLIDYKSGRFKEEISKIDLNRPVLLYCRTGKRSALAMQEMVDMGFKEVYNMQGGIMKWNSNSID